MIKCLDIKKFGCFSNFDWKAALKEEQTVHDFKRLNIVYGRNYSGKTTLSRIFRSYEVGHLPENFKNPEFQITSDEGGLNQGDIQSHKLDIRVYNRDFIDENLSFLNDPVEGEVKTFAIIGSKNKEIEKQIEEAERNLGSVEARSGIRYEYAQKNEDYTDKNAEAVRAEQALKEKLRRHANDVIKLNRTFGNPDYNINSIKKDIETVDKKTFSILDETEVQRRQDLLKEEALPDIERKVSFHPAFLQILDGAKKVLGK